MSLGGLSLAAGMLVDNSIVVLDNINRRLGLKRDTNIADECAAGTREVAMPVVAATLTTVAGVFPVIYVTGIAGPFLPPPAPTGNVPPPGAVPPGGVAALGGLLSCIAPAWVVLAPAPPGGRPNPGWRAGQQPVTAT